MSENTDSADQNPVKLPLRRRAQLSRVLAGEPVGQASIAVGYKNEQSGRTALADTRKRLLDVMDHYTLTPEGLVRDYLLPLLNACKTTFYTKDGIVQDERTVEDNGTRLSALDMTWKLRGSYPRDDSNGPVNLNININNMGNVE